MVPRYSRPEMAGIWAPENRYRIWFEIEALAAEGMARVGDIPQDAARTIRARGDAKVATIGPEDIARIDAIERETRHDVIAFLTWLAESIGPDSRFLHQGMTSSDVLDTCLSVQLTQAADLLLRDIDDVLAALKVRAFEHKHTLTIGRSHGIHAEPTTFGIKLAGHYAEFARDRARLVAARAEIAVAAISGAVGTFAHLDPRVEEFVAERLGLSVEPVSTQVIPRDRHAAFFCTLAVIASGIERLATEVRHLQRSEVREAEEFFNPGQKGSSAMPHKRNPVLSENLTGLARVVRATAVPALENVALWHERDISHSSVERVIAPDATIALDFALARLAGMMQRLTVYPERMAANLEALGGVVHSGEVLLALTRAGILREDAYRLVQRHAMETWQSLGHPGTWLSFKQRLLADPEIAGRVSAKDIDHAMDPALHLREDRPYLPARVRRSGTEAGRACIMITGARTPLTVDLTGLRVAISAGAGGIGRVMADSFATCGAQVFVSDVDEAALANCPYPKMRADAGVVAECEAFVDAAANALGGLDVLVNNAGIAGPTALVEDVDPAGLDATLRVDLASMFHCARRAIPHLRRAGGGAVINLSSAAGRFGFPLRAPYSAAKWGVIGFTKSLSIELGPDGILRERYFARAGGRTAHSRRDQGEGRGSADFGERDDGAYRWHDQPAVFRHPAGHREHGALSGEPVRRDHQRPGHFG